MKTKSVFLMMLLVAASCQKSNQMPLSQQQPENNPICFKVSDALEASVGTKAVSDVTTANLSSIFVTASSGSAGTSETAWPFLSNAAVSLTSGSGKSSVYWPASGNLSFYATNWNVDKSVSASGASLNLDYAGGVADYVAGYVSNVNNGDVAQISMNHIFCRLCDIKFKSSENAQATVTAVSITPANVKGSYTFRTNSWSMQSGTPSALAITPVTTSFSPSSYTSIGSSAADHTFLPGDVTVNVSYTVTADGYNKSFDKSAVVTLEQGFKSTVSAELTDDKTPISFSVSVTPWKETDKTVILN